MKDNARNVPGPTRSCRTGLSRSATSPRRRQTTTENPYKTRTKSDHFHECYFSNSSAQTTYNFNALKCTDFLDTPSFPPLKNQSPAAESQDARPGRLGECYPFSLGEKVRMRDKPVILPGRSTLATRLPYTVQNETKRDDLDSFNNLNTLYQPLTTTTRPAVPFSREFSRLIADEVTRLSIPVKLVSICGSVDSTVIPSECWIDFYLVHPI